VKDKVIEAIKAAFSPEELEEHLRETNGRVFGSVTVRGSDRFDSLIDHQRQRLLWEQLRILLGYDATKVGPVVLKPLSRG
jgi:hypothetical protein